MLAENSSINLVGIATESGNHARTALDVIAAGKHVMIEKPIALSMADADEIIRSGKSHMVLLQFENGSCTTIEGTTTIFKRSEEACLCLYGINGTARLGGVVVNKIESWNFLDDRKIDADEEISNVYGNSHSRLFMDMIRAIENDTAPLVDAQAEKMPLR